MKWNESSASASIVEIFPMWEVPTGNDTQIIRSRHFTLSKHMNLILFQAFQPKYGFYTFFLRVQDLFLK